MPLVGEGTCPIHVDFASVGVVGSEAEHESAVVLRVLVIDAAPCRPGLVAVVEYSIYTHSLSLKVC